MKKKIWVGVVSAITGLVVVAAPASAATKPWNVTMFSGGDYVGAGLQQSYYDGNGTISMSSNGTELDVNIGGGTAGKSFTLTFAAPAGTPLHRGFYDGAQRTPFRSGGRPGIDIYGDGRGCNTQAGRFDVLDFKRDQTGKVTSVWMTYEQHCEGGIPALFGEVRYGAPNGNSRTSASRVWFPDTNLNANSTVVPVRLVMGPNAGDVTSATITGAGFAIRSDGCTGQHLNPGGVCVVYVRFEVKRSGGPRYGLLSFDTTQGRPFVELEGSGVIGHTELSMTSDPGDYIGGGISYDYVPGTDVVAVSGTTSHISLSIDGGNGDWWYGDWDAADGDIIAPGTYNNATRYPFNGSGNGLDVEGNGRGCNTLTGSFTVNSVQFDGNGNLQELDLTFVQHCEGTTPALRGHVQYLVPPADHTPPGSVTSLTATPATSSASLSWTNPAAADLTGVVVRYVQGTVAPPMPMSGFRGGNKLSTSRSLTGLLAHTKYTASVFTVDKTGNVGYPTTITFTTAAA